MYLYQFIIKKGQCPEPKWYSHSEYFEKTYYNLENEKLPVHVTKMFSTFSRAQAHDTRLDMILDEPHSQTQT